MADFIARFVGGPCDGKTLPLRVDLETVEWVEKPAPPGVQLMERTSAPRDIGERIFYRRSMKTRNVYVYQP